MCVRGAEPEEVLADTAPVPLFSHRTRFSVASLACAAASALTFLYWFANPGYPGASEVFVPLALGLSLVLAAAGLLLAIVGLARREGLAIVVSAVACVLAAVPSVVFLLPIVLFAGSK